MKIQGRRQQIRRHENAAGENSLFQSREMIFLLNIYEYYESDLSFTKYNKEWCIIVYMGVERQKILPAQSL